jgi:hypothetical protein
MTMKIVRFGEKMNIYGVTCRWLVLDHPKLGLVRISAGGTHERPETMASREANGEEIASFKGHDILRMLKLIK